MPSLAPSHQGAAGPRTAALQAARLCSPSSLATGEALQLPFHSCLEARMAILECRLATLLDVAFACWDQGCPYRLQGSVWLSSLLCRMS